MASFRMMHCRTGAVLLGYRVTSATEGEIAQANHNLRRAGSDYRLVVDLHPPVKADAVCDDPADTHPAAVTTTTPA